MCIRDSSVDGSSNDSMAATRPAAIFMSFMLKEDSDFRNERDVVPAGIRTGPKSRRNNAVVWTAAAGRSVIMPRRDAAAEVAAEAATMAAFTAPSFTAGRSRGGR